jgi:hypothetical protein
MTYSRSLCISCIRSVRVSRDRSQTHLLDPSCQLRWHHWMTDPFVLLGSTPVSCAPADNRRASNTDRVRATLYPQSLGAPVDLQSSGQPIAKA